LILAYYLAEEITVPIRVAPADLAEARDDAANLAAWLDNRQP
jgi:hypothetical protein